AGARQRIGPTARDLDRAVGGRPLFDLTAKPIERRLDGRARRRGTGDTGQGALEVVGRGRGAEADRRLVALPIAEVVVDEPCGPAKEDRQDAAREWVQRSAVADPLRRA